jgi:hypothetical protein
MHLIEVVKHAMAGIVSAAVEKFGEELALQSRPLGQQRSRDPA